MPDIALSSCPAMAAISFVVCRAGSTCRAITTIEPRIAWQAVAKLLLPCTRCLTSSEQEMMVVCIQPSSIILLFRG